MSSSSSSSAAAVKGFVAGAVVTAASVAGYWKFRQLLRPLRPYYYDGRRRNRRRDDDDNDDADDNTSAQASSSSSTSSAQTQPQPQPLFDSPDLDMRLVRKAEAVIQGRSSVVVVVERCTNDHNYSAILRTAEALGVQRVYVIDPLEPSGEDGHHTGNNDNNVDCDTNGTAKAEHNNSAATTAVTATKKNKNKNNKQNDDLRRWHHLFAQNATEWLTVRDFETAELCLRALREEGYQVWSTDLSQRAVPLTEGELRAALRQQGGGGGGAQQRHPASTKLKLPSKLAVVFGTEAVGVSQYMLEQCDMRVYAPLRGFADSLNLSVAAALVLHHLFLLDPDLVGNLPESGKQQLRREWFPKLATQRLLTSRQKKDRKKLMHMLQDCDELERKKVELGEELTKEQKLKLQQRSKLRERLQTLERKAGFDLAERALQDLIANPPAPLTDIRRCDDHRVCYVGRNTKKRYEEHWKDMPAVKNLHSIPMVAAQDFRDRVQAVASVADSTTTNGSTMTNAGSARPENGTADPEQSQANG